MERNRPQLNLDELQRLRWLLGELLILLSVWTMAYADIDAWLLTGVTTLAVLAVLAFPALPARVPSLAHKLAFPFIVVFFVWDLYTNGEPLPAMMRLDLLLLLYRGVSYRRKRDDLQIIVLGLILVMMTGVLTVSLAFAAQILVFTAATLAFLFVINLSEHAAGSAAPAAGEEEPVPAWARLGWKRFARRLAAVADPRLLLLSGVLFGGVLAVSALLFTAIPRFQLETGFFFDRLISRKSLTGFSDTIRLGDVVDIQQDNAVALRVDVSDPAQVPAMPYWRMVVLDEYHDGVLRMSRRLRDEIVLGARMRPDLQGTLPRPVRPAVVWTFYLEAGISRYLPLTGSFYRLRFEDPERVFEQFPLSIVALRNEPVTMTAYRVDDMTTDGFVRDLMFGPMLRHAERVRAEGRAWPKANEPGRPAVTYPLTTLQLPAHAADREALQRMVTQIEGGTKLTAEAFAARATAWLRRRHGYSLHVKLPRRDRDPVVTWLESDLPGHCELFTAAFTLLSRAAGFPARAVTGFRGGVACAGGDGLPRRRLERLRKLLHGARFKRPRLVRGIQRAHRLVSGGPYARQEFGGGAANGDGRGRDSQTARPKLAGPPRRYPHSLVPAGGQLRPTQPDGDHPVGPRHCDQLRQSAAQRAGRLDDDRTRVAAAAMGFRPASALARSDRRRRFCVCARMERRPRVAMEPRGTAAVRSNGSRPARGGPVAAKTGGLGNFEGARDRGHARSVASAIWPERVLARPGNGVPPRPSDHARRPPVGLRTAGHRLRLRRVGEVIGWLKVGGADASASLE